MFFDSSEPMDYHYVTITGIYQNKVLNKTYLRVQSWGDVYYIDYNEFFKYNENSDLITWSGDLIFVT